MQAYVFERKLNFFGKDGNVVEIETHFIPAIEIVLASKNGLRKGDGSLRLLSEQTFFFL